MEQVLKISDCDHFTGQASSLAHLSHVNFVMKKKLTQVQLKMFRCTVFGQFVDVDFVFCSGLVYYFLLREVADVRPEVMTFNIRGSNITFSKSTFLIITGLWQPHVTIAQKEWTGYLVQKYFSQTLDEDSHTRRNL